MAFVPSMKERNRRVNRAIDITKRVRANEEASDKRRLRDDQKYDLITNIILKELEKRNLTNQENLKDNLEILIEELLERPSFSNRLKKEEVHPILNATMRKVNSRNNQIDER